MIVVRGINVFPSQIEHILMKIPDAGDSYQVVITREGTLDEMKVRVEMKDELFRGELEDFRRIQSKIQKELLKEVGLRINVDLVEKGTLERFKLKAKRVLDMRKDTI
jgi:phenylacetate-CoA ligase